MNNITPKFHARQDNGRLMVGDGKTLAQYLRTLGNKDLELTVRVQKKHRSDNQNRYYWAVCVGMIAQETAAEGSGGHLAEKIHEALKNQFLKQHLLINGHEVETTGSTADLTTVEFEAYLAQVRKWAEEFLGIVIPEPNEIDMKESPWTA